MVIRKVYIQQWSILFLFSFDQYDMDRIYDALLWAGAPNSVISHVEQNVHAGCLNEGFTYSEPSLRRTVVSVGKTSTGPEFMNTTVHEVAHVALHIAQEDKIDPYSEELAYLIGDITQGVSDIVCELSCPHCRKKVL